MANGIFRVGGATEDKIFESPYSVDYPEDWTFDETTEITLCSDLDGANSIECNIHNLKLGYSIDSLKSPVDLIEKGFHSFIFANH